MKKRINEKIRYIGPIIKVQKIDFQLMYGPYEFDPQIQLASHTCINCPTTCVEPPGCR